MGGRDFPPRYQQVKHMLKEIKYGALSGKARAMYGKLLTREDYMNLIQKKSVSEVVSYLKHNTHYSGLLSETDENDIHRVNLEILLKKDIINDYNKFFKFSNGQLKELIELFYTKTEIECLKLIFRMFEAGNAKHELIEESLVFLSRHDKLNIPKLSLSRDLEEFLSRLQETEYYELLKPFALDDREVRLFNMEMTLDLYYFRKMQRTYQKLLDKSDAHIIKDFLGLEADMFNIFLIYRGKMFYNMPDQIIKSYLARVEGKLDKKTMEALMEAGSHDAFMDVLRKSPYGFLFEGHDQPFLEHSYLEYVYKLHKTRFRRQPFSIACIISYLRLKETEISNIISIIEGIRYGLSGRETGKFVTGIRI